jgi:hypothetical protein
MRQLKAGGVQALTVDERCVTECRGVAASAVDLIAKRQTGARLLFAFFNVLQSVRISDIIKLCGVPQKIKKIKPFEFSRPLFNVREIP